MSLRYASCFVMAAAVTFGLFFLMQTLIAQGLGGDRTVIASHSIDMVRLKRELEADRKRRLPERTPAKEKPPPPPIDPHKARKPQTETLDVGVASLDFGFDFARPDLGAVPSDNAPIPLVRVQPLYPERAAQRGIEGWVLLEFTISETGRVEDPAVSDADPANIFDRAALRAIRRWKYKPKIVDGKPVRQPHVRTLISFRMED